jgi:hypothetical protein
MYCSFIILWPFVSAFNASSAALSFDQCSVILFLAVIFSSEVTSLWAQTLYSLVEVYQYFRGP